MEVGKQTRREDGGMPAREHSRRHRGPAARYRAFRRGLQVNPLLDLTWRIGVLTVGGLVVATGIALLALPGPGWATIFVGFMILASEFAWARRSLDWAKERARSAQVKAMAPEVRRRNQVLSVVVATMIVGAVVWYWQTHGFPGPVGNWLIDVWNT
jgi:uncharacterized protein (TIGR02611 family)